MLIPYKKMAAATLWSLLIGTPLAHAEIFVTTDSGNTIQVFSNSATGNATPLRSITVGAQPRGIYVDQANGEIYVALVNDGVNVYSINATGAATPVRSFTQNSSGNPADLGDFQGIHVANDEIYIANRDGSVTVFPRLTSGVNIAPSRSIVGASTGVQEPRGVFVSGNELFVAENSPRSIRVFTRTASGDVAPLRVITNTTAPNLGEVSQLLVANSEVTVADFGSGAIRTWPSITNGDTLPSRMIRGGTTLLNSPRGVALCSDSNTLVVANRNGDSLNFYATSADGDVAPTKTITGASTGLVGPRFVACTSDMAPATTPVPTLSEWGMIGLSSLLALGAFFGMRRREVD
jgi:DNA-binding beta-propeller fold protein YncE